MRLRILKAYTNSIRTFPIGQIIRVHGSEAKRLIDENIAEEYNGEYPPKKKMKTNFFNPNK